MYVSTFPAVEDVVNDAAHVHARSSNGVRTGDEIFEGAVGILSPVSGGVEDAVVGEHGDADGQAQIAL